MFPVDYEMKKEVKIRKSSSQMCMSGGFPPPQPFLSKAEILQELQKSEAV